MKSGPLEPFHHRQCRSRLHGDRRHHARIVGQRHRKPLGVIGEAWIVSFFPDGDRSRHRARATDLIEFSRHRRCHEAITRRGLDLNCADGSRLRSPTEAGHQISTRPDRRRDVGVFGRCTGQIRQQGAIPDQLDLVIALAIDPTEEYLESSTLIAGDRRDRIAGTNRIGGTVRIEAIDQAIEIVIDTVAAIFGLRYHHVDL